MATRDEVYVDIVTQTKKAVKSMAKYAAGVAAAVVVVRAIYKAVKGLEDAYFIQEQAERKLTAAITATGRESEISAQSMFDYAASLQKTTTFGDEAIISATALLQQLSNLDEQGLKKVIPSMLDFSTAMGVDLQTAASLIGKTLGSSTNALTRYGVEIDMSGTKSEKLSSLVEGLTDKFGGVAEVIGETAFAAKEQLSNALGDLQESGGSLISIVLEPLRRKLTNVVAAFDATIRRVFDLNKVLITPKAQAEYVYALENQLAAEESILEALEEKKTVLESQQNITGEQAHLKALTGELLIVEDSTEALKDATQEIAISEAKIEAIAVDLLVAQERLKLFAAVFPDLEIVGETFEEWLRSVSPIAQAERDLVLVTSDLNRAQTNLTTALKEGWDQWYIDALTEAIQLLGENKTALENMISPAEELGSVFGDWLSTEATGLEITNILLGRQIELWVALGKAVTDNTEYFVSFKEQSEEWVGTLGALFGAIGESFIDMEKGVESAKEAIKDLVASQLIAQAKLWAAQAFAAFVPGPTFNPVAGVGLTAAAAAALVGAGLVQALGEGGIVNSPTLAVIGEKGPEAVIPLNKGMGGGVTVNFYGPVAGERAFEDIAYRVFAEVSS